jgi:hypothetical protein
MPEVRSRITILLPAPETLPQFLLLNDVVTDFVKFCEGATVSSWQPHVWNGWWINERKGMTELDANVMLIGDSLALMTSRALAYYLEHLKRHCQEVFDQEIVWVTMHEITRVSEGDYQKR